MCGKLLKSLYGTRNAASNWEDCYIEFLKRKGIISGTASPCVFMHSEKKVWRTAHGDDFTILGSDTDLNLFEDMIKDEFEVKARGRPGRSEEYDKSIMVLNGIVE